MKKYNYVAYIGRMEPPTRAHISNIKHALEISEHVIILFGSCFQPRTIKNPFKLSERITMVSNHLTPSEISRITFEGLHDYRYNDQDWITQVRKIVKKESFLSNSENTKIGIIGCNKDESSRYLNWFPNWELIETPLIEDIDATTVRNELFTGKLFSWHDKDLISPELLKFLSEWRESEHYRKLVREYEFIQNYKQSWKSAPYPPSFNTVDAVVIQSGYVLMIQRKAAPGENLLALPGGFINENEFIIDACIRELREETRLKVPDPVLRGSIIGNKVFDNPQRSLRGRTITHAYAFELPSGPLSKVKGGDDAKHAKWYAIDDILDSEELIFEDHLDIIRWAISECK
jgi:bifunctional NMN adenylyltransferase/nudix hydrolase